MAIVQQLDSAQNTKAKPSAGFDAEGRLGRDFRLRSESNDRRSFPKKIFAAAEASSPWAATFGLRAERERFSDSRRLEPA
jgi:hypothetical protein